LTGHLNSLAISVAVRLWRLRLSSNCYWWDRCWCMCWCLSRSSGWRSCLCFYSLAANWRSNYNLCFIF